MRSAARCSGCWSRAATCCEWVTADRAVVPATLGGVSGACGWRRCSPLVAARSWPCRPAPAAAGLANPGAVVPVAAARLRHRAAARASAPAARRANSARHCAARRGGPGGSSKSCSTPADNWLIPDNYQENRARRHRPSHLADQHRPAAAGRARRLRLRLSQHHRRLDRLEPTFDTLLRMQRYRGHFYNWYDTRTLAPLPPAYISTVDSGNLAGYLLTLGSGLTELTESRPLVDASVLEGLGDVLDLFEAEIVPRDWRITRPYRPPGRRAAHRSGTAAGDAPRLAHDPRRHPRAADLARRCCCTSSTNPPQAPAPDWRRTSPRGTRPDSGSSAPKRRSPDDTRSSNASPAG